MTVGLSGSLNGTDAQRFLEWLSQELLRDGKIVVQSAVIDGKIDAPRIIVELTDQGMIAFDFLRGMAKTKGTERV